MRIHPMAWLIGMLIALLYVPVARRFLAAVEKLPAPGTWSWYPVAKDFQAGVGSLLGLLAIGFGAWLTYLFAVRRDNQKVEDERRSIASAIGAEILTLNLLLEEQARLLHETASNAGCHAITHIEINPVLGLRLLPAHFTELGAKIGNLPPYFTYNVNAYFATVSLLNQQLTEYVRQRKEELNLVAQGIEVKATIAVEALTTISDALLHNVVWGADIATELITYAESGVLPVKHFAPPPPAHR